MSNLFPTCKETSRLLTRAIDGHLSWGERLQMRLHIFVCRNCSIFERQLQQIAQWLGWRQEKEEGLPEEARHRIQRALKEREK